MTERRVISKSALFLLLSFLGPLDAWGQEEGEKSEPERGPASSEERRADAGEDEPPLPPPRATPSAVAVQVDLKNTDLQQAQILQALANEFRVPVLRGDGKVGLRLIVDGQNLEASYRDEKGQLIERKLQLPRDKARQLDTIALLSGNLARDEAGELLAELRAEESDEESLAEAVLPEAVPPEGAPQAEEPPVPPPEEGAEGEPALEEGAGDEVEEKGSSEDASEDPSSADEPERPELPLAEFSAALWGDLTYPLDLDEKKTYVHLGVVHSEIGSLKGFAGNLLLLRNRGRGRDYAGEGVQMAIIWAGTDGYFRGFHGAVVAATGQGGIEGVQGSAVFTFQKNETLGAQVAGVATVSMSHIEGGQGGGIFAGTWGDIRGVQGAGTVAITTGDLTGVQLSGAASVVGGKMDGFQLGAVSWAEEVDGFQMGVANVAAKKMDGFQLGVGNFAGDFDGTQIGIVNVGGKVDGAQIGLVNVAKDVDGVAIAPVNVIPGIRNQIVTYGSWAPVTNSEAAPAGPLIHLGLKFMPDPFYTQLSLGMGAEAEECPSGLLPGDAGCTGNGLRYAPAFAIGVRGRIVRGLFTEFDVQYQFEKAFSSSRAHRHAVLGRAALGYDFNEKFGIYGGGGPRMDVRVASDGTVEPLVQWSPHVFAGIQVF